MASLAGLWLGLTLPPIRSTLASYWQQPASAGVVSGSSLAAGSTAAADRRLLLLLRSLAVLAVIAIAVGVVALGLTVH